MSVEKTREWVEQQDWYKPQEKRHYSEGCRKNKCSCIRQEELESED